MKTLALVVTLTFVLAGCNEIAKQLTPNGKKLVTADSKVYMACTGKVDVTHQGNGYAVHLTDRDWNNAKTAYTDKEVYLEAKEVTVREMTPDEINVCKGHYLPMPQAQTQPPPAGDDDCYDANGNLMPNEAAAFGGTLSSCGPGHTRKPRSERAQVPASWRAWVEQWETCDKGVVDGGHSTKEAFDACRAKAEATRPKNN